MKVITLKDVLVKGDPVAKHTVISVDKETAAALVRAKGASADPKKIAALSKKAKKDEKAAE